MVEFSADGAKVAAAVGFRAPVDFRWTQDVVSVPLTVGDLQGLVDEVRQLVADAKLVLPEAEGLIKRSVTALLAGHLVLQGPPGTGKTTFARILAKAFKARLEITTATAEWSTYDVVGGLRPTESSSLQPALGSVSSSVLRCAEQVQASEEDQAVWLLIDELNRADIDKAIGPLYTVLSSTAPEHLASTPLELWFEQGHGAFMWVPSRYRILATMNDVDTSFVNTISQGLTRRFQFVYVGVPVGAESVHLENESCRKQAEDWVKSQYQGLVEQLEDLVSAREPELQGASSVLESFTDFVRNPISEVKWPLGSAQITDVWRSLLLLLLIEGPNPGRPVLEMLDDVLADRVLPQAGALDDDQLVAIHSWLEGQALSASSGAVDHLRDTRSTI